MKTRRRRRVEFRLPMIRSLGMLRELHLRVFGSCLESVLPASMKERFLSSPSFSVYGFCLGQVSCADGTQRACKAAQDTGRVRAPTLTRLSVSYLDYLLAAQIRL